MTNAARPSKQRKARVRDRVEEVRGWVQRSVAWQVWERMLEIEFVDRSVALAGKAFVSFFPLVIVIAAFMPKSDGSAPALLIPAALLEDRGLHPVRLSAPVHLR